MPNTPLHPAVVHIPIGVAMILPIVCIFIAWSIWKGRFQKNTWIIVMLLQAIAFGGGGVAFKTGENEEDTVEKVVKGSLIHEHEEWAEKFLWSSGATFALGVAGFVIPGASLANAARVASATGTVVSAAMAMFTGREGGELVYVHGAASAYTSPSPPSSGASNNDHDHKH